LGAAALRTFLLGFVLFCVPGAAVAQNTMNVVKFLAGGAVGLGIHEMGHTVLGVSVGTTPGLKAVRFGPIPFFAITHDPVSPAREFAISSAGFWMQHLGSELILAQRPHLRDEDAPFRKGVLAFNILASAAYAGAAFAHAGPAERDTRGMAVSASIREPWVGVWVAAPAVLDAARYFRRDDAWLRWISRVVKIGGVLLVVRAAD
jgi:hypothetical protein